MLGLLRMDINSCISEYLKLAPVIFPLENSALSSKPYLLIKASLGWHRFDPLPFERAVQELVRAYVGEVSGEGCNTPMKFQLRQSGMSGDCRV